LQLRKSDVVPAIAFRSKTSVHFDKRTYSFNGEMLSLYTLSGRILVKTQLGKFQRQYLENGKPKEAELVGRHGQWFFNLVLELANSPSCGIRKKVFGVDMGENNLVATSTGKLFGGGELRHNRDCALALRGRLQSNGTKSSKQLLAKISGRESRHIRHENHVISKMVVEEALVSGCDTIALECLTNIRKRIRAGKRMRSRLHGWAWAQLQKFIQYKAEAAGLRVTFVNPAYTSQTCAQCGQLGTRDRHRFECKFCGIRRHSDLNASQNIRRIAMSADVATGDVNHPNVATD
jgi:IS605 OrfB family transposase